MTIGQRILQIRTSCGLSQEEFGEKLGTTRQTVSKWETDITVPEIEKIVKMSKLFSITTDSILIEGISTFDDDNEKFICGIYKSNTIEIIETERITLIYYMNPDGTVFGAKAYTGFDNKKDLMAVCEYRTDKKTTEYAYVTNTGAVLTNGDTLQNILCEKYDVNLKKSLYRSETFYVSHKNTLPTVSKEGIKRCLLQWRMSTTMNNTLSRFSIYICTDKSEYVFDIEPHNSNIYCAISNNVVTELGLFAGKQFFRIRNYKDNSDRFCESYCNLGVTVDDIIIPTSECVGGKCVNTSKGYFFGIKRYNDNEIVLVGCGDDEYHYSRLDKKLEILSLM